MLLSSSSSPHSPFSSSVILLSFHFYAFPPSHALFSLLFPLTEVTIGSHFLLHFSQHSLNCTITKINRWHEILPEINSATRRQKIRVGKIYQAIINHPHCHKIKMINYTHQCLSFLLFFLSYWISKFLSTIPFISLFSLISSQTSFSCWYLNLLTFALQGNLLFILQVIMREISKSFSHFPYLFLQISSRFFFFNRWLQWLQDMSWYSLLINR